MVTVHIPLGDISGDLNIPDQDVREGLRSIGCSVEEDGIEINPNRPDLFSRPGLERALRHYFFRELKEYSADAPGMECANERPAIRPFIACAVLKGIKLDDRSIRELVEFQELLHLTLGRNRRFAAIGLHDLDKVSSPFRYRNAHGDERFVPLGSDREISISEILKENEKGIEYRHLVESDKGLYPLLEDSHGRALSMPPIINGNVTALTESTRRLFIDVTGISEYVPCTVLNLIICDLLERFRGAKAERVRIITGDDRAEYPTLDRTEMGVNVRETARIIGADIPIGDMIDALNRMGHVAYKAAREEELRVKIPCYRSDIMHPQDIFEEIAIGHGYDRLGERLPESWTLGRKKFSTRDTLREIFIGLGFMEVTTLNLSSAEEQQELMGLERGASVEILNPVSNLGILRFWLIPSLLSILRANRHNPLPHKIFECDQLQDCEHACCLIEDTSADFREIKSIAEALFHSMGTDASYERIDHPSFIKGRCATMMIDGESAGLIGELHPRVLRNFQLESPVCALELRWEERE